MGTTGAKNYGKTSSDFSLILGLAIVQSLNSRPMNAQSPVESQAGPRGIFVRQSGTETGVSSA
jgi:hypothetical protein